MADVQINDGTLTVTLKGWHKLWALKSDVTVPLEHVVDAEFDPELRWHPKGMRLPGSFLPGVITAGSYRGREGWEFWDVRRPEKAIVIHLRDERYTRLVVEVDDPQQTVTMIRQALQVSPGSPPAGN